jgi:PleD family two-component response regulator
VKRAHGGHQGDRAASTALREEVGKLPIETPRASWPGKLTVSAGVASWPDDGAWPDELLHAADDRLLAAKRAGRNRVFGPRDRDMVSASGRAD